MATVEQVAKAALQRILVQGSESPLEADEYDDFIFHLNNFMSDLEAKNIVLGYTVVDNISDTVTVPPGALRGIISNMAIEVAPDYGGTVSAELIASANAGMKALRIIGKSLKASAFPSTLPRGSGNEPIGYGYVSPFYHDSEETILAESTAFGLVYMSTGATTTISVVNAPVLLSGTFTASVQSLFTASTAGRLAYTSEAPIRVPVTATVAATAGTDTLGFMIAKNGTPIQPSAVSGTTGGSATWMVEFIKDDYVEIFVENRTDTSGIAATAATLRAG